MKKKFPRSLIFASTFVLAFLQCLSAQQPAADKPGFPNAGAEPREFRLPNFRERELGWVSGRIYDITGDEAEPLNIAEVKVILRSSEAGFGSFIREQVSNEDGVYDFQSLGAGEYTVAIDSASLPAKYRLNGISPAAVTVKPLGRSYVNLPILPQRVITGTVFIDTNGDGRYTDGKDTAVEGASVAANGSFVMSDANGAYVLRDLPAGRVGILVTVPNRVETTHVVLDLGSGPVTNRVVNVPLNR